VRRLRRGLLRTVVVLFAAGVAVAGMPVFAAFASDTTSAPSPSLRPSGTTPATGLGSAGHGTGFVVLAVIIVAALVFSGWRLRRDR
jgi:hypothetical protein